MKQRGWRKTAVPSHEIRRLWREAEKTGLFEPIGNPGHAPAGHDLEYPIDRDFTDAEIGKILAWCEEVASTVRKYGLREEKLEHVLSDADMEAGLSLTE